MPGPSSRGVDLDVTLQVTKNIHIVATAASMDAKARSQANSAAAVIVNPVNNVAETHPQGPAIGEKVRLAEPTFDDPLTNLHKRTLAFFADCASFSLVPLSGTLG